jgi:hypothetical protein
VFPLCGDNFLILDKRFCRQRGRKKENTSVKMAGWEPREAGKMVEVVAELLGVAVVPLDMEESQMLERKRAKAETTGREEHRLGLQLA